MLSLRSYPAFILTAHFQSVISYSLGSYISSLVTLYASVLSLLTIQVSQLSQSVGSDATPVPHNYCLMEFEAENGVTSGQTMQRSRASGGLSVSLTRAGQHVTHTFSTDTVCTAQVHSVLYSNDGQSDVVQVSLDGTTMGTFRTQAKSNYGYDTLVGHVRFRCGSAG